MSLLVGEVPLRGYTRSAEEVLLCVGGIVKSREQKQEASSTWHLDCIASDFIEGVAACCAGPATSIPLHERCYGSEPESWPRLVLAAAAFHDALDI